MNILNIQSSPRAAKSASIHVADAFFDAYRSRYTDLTIDTLNVFEENLPDFDGEAIGAKYKGVSKAPMDANEQRIWDTIVQLTQRFQQADRIVLGVPMWNFAYPYKLEQLIDLVCQRNFLFTFTDGVYGPLLKTPRALVVYARGQTYAENTPMPPSTFDHQTHYINFWLRFIGVVNVQSLIVENTWSEREEQTVAEARARAAQLATTF